jgi:hypothetical protein
MEPQWMKQISNELVCNFFYVFFVVYAVIAVISLVGVIGIFTFLKVPKGQLGAIGIQGLIGLALATTQMLFLYLICDRALKPGAAAAPEDVPTRK